MSAKSKKGLKDIDPGIAALLISVCIFVICIFVSICLIQHNVHKAKSNFSETVQKVSDSMYSEMYNYAENKYHVSNRIAVEINNILESSKLEVLNASDTEFITEEKDKNEDVTSWLQVEGNAVFTVDMSAAQYIYDVERNTITVVVPYPEVTSCRLTRAKNLLFEEDFSLKNGSYRDGQNLAVRQFHSGYLKLLNYFSKNSMLLKSAKQSGELLIKNLILQLYDDKDINIEVIYKRMDD